MMIEDTTFLIKTFLRPDCLARVLFSIHRQYPHTPTIVVDDSENMDSLHTCRPYSNVRLIVTGEKDVGISRGRNIGLKEIETTYFVLLDDDCVLWRLSDIEFMKRRLEETGADIVCGPMCSLESGKVLQSAMAFESIDGQTVLVKRPLPPGHEGWVMASNNFFFAKTQIRESVTWPDALKTHEHGPFFFLLHRSGARVWTSHISSVGHYSTNNKEYDSYRYRVRDATDSAAIAACRDFRVEYDFVWIRSEVECICKNELQESEIGWRREIEPWCDTQRQFLLYTQSYRSSNDRPYKKITLDV